MVRRGEANREQVRDLLQQFSVFSNLFIVAQLLKTINAPTMKQAREFCEILVNELGVVFNSGRTSPKDGGTKTDADKDREGDPDLVSTEGTVDGGVYRFNARHFEWLVKVGEAVGLGFDDLGKRKFGREETLFFCDELARIYGSDDPDVAEGASFAVEHWAAAGFWKQLIKGLDGFRQREAPTSGSPSSHGTTASRTSTPPTPWTSSREHSSAPASTSRSSSRARPRCSTA